MENKLLRRLFIFLLCVVSCGGAQVAPSTLDFGVFSLFKPKHLLVRPAKNQTVLLTMSKTSVALDSEFEVSSGREGLRIVANGHSYRAESLLVTARNGGATDFVLAVPGKIERKFRGTLLVAQKGGVIVPVVTIDRELAVASAVKAEAPPGAPMEALKAQAVVARSFYLGSRDRHHNFDFCDTTHCQLLKEPPATSDPAAVAAQQTRGITLHYRGQSWRRCFQRVAEAAPALWKKLASSRVIILTTRRKTRTASAKRSAGLLGWIAARREPCRRVTPSMIAWRWVER